MCFKVHLYFLLKNSKSSCTFPVKHRASYKLCYLQIRECLFIKYREYRLTERSIAAITLTFDIISEEVI